MPESAFENLARNSLVEITPAENVGAYFSEVDEGDGIVSVLFDSAMPGYPDWKWTVSIAQVEGEQPTVLEAELMPGEGALLSPDWVPWSDRLAEFEAAQESAESNDDDEDDDDEDDDDEDDDDEDDDDDDESDDDDDHSDDDDDVLHAGDVDGVDIDSLDDEDLSDDDDDDSREDDEQDKSY